MKNNRTRLELDRRIRLRIRLIIAPILILFALGLWTTSCTSSRTSTHERTSEGVYHIIQRGQTLYRIAKTYGVPLNLLVKINDIPDPDRISVGDAIFIPGAESRLHVEPYYAYAGALPALPVNGTITSPFGAQRRGYLHTGLDISAPAGTPIRAALPGVVSFSGKQRRYGNIVILEHANGYSSVYAHNHRNLVKTGDRVKKGQHIALVGRSGNATGFHLHFELHKDGRPVNPIDFIKAGK